MLIIWLWFGVMIACVTHEEIEKWSEWVFAIALWPFWILIALWPKDRIF